MKEFNPITRVYTKIVREWKYYDEEKQRNITTQYEIAYKDYDTETEKLVGQGTADFSPERKRDQLKCYFVQVYNGRVNHSGGKMTDTIGRIMVNHKTCAIKAARLVYGDQVARVDKF